MTWRDSYTQARLGVSKQETTGDRSRQNPSELWGFKRSGAQNSRSMRTVSGIGLRSSASHEGDAREERKRRARWNRRLIEPPDAATPGRSNRMRLRDVAGIGLARLQRIAIRHVTVDVRDGE